MPQFVVDRVVDALNETRKSVNGSRVHLYGVAYKRDVDDVRESPALAIVQELERRLARVSYHDPHVPLLRSRHLYREMQSVPLTPETLRSYDAALIVTDHSSIDYPMLLDNCRLLIDSRNASAPSQA